MKLSHHGVDTTLAGRVCRGEIHFGEHVNLAAHEPIITEDLWQRVQRVTVPTGRKAKSDRILARLGVLRCATCDGRMVASKSHSGTYHTYRCPHNNDCARHVTIGAELVEKVVADKAREILSGVKGRASATRTSAKPKRG